MASFRFIHTADIHLDSPLIGLAGQEGSLAERIRAAPREAFDTLIGQAMQENVDFVVIAGDLYDGNWRDFQTGLFFVRQMGRLAANGIPVFLLFGNHDAANQITRSLALLQYARLKVCDQNGVEVEQGATGELLIKGPAVTPGYWNRAETNKEAFTDDGWFRTGDAARQDEDGFYYIVDRWKDMFISGGENVYPVEVENVIYQLDGVLETAVVATAHEMWGEVGRAFVVSKPGCVLDEHSIVAHCRKNLAGYKVPREVRFVDELPHNATGKILKHQLPRD